MTVTVVSTVSIRVDRGLCVRIPGVVEDSSDFALSREQLRLLGGVFALLGLLEFGGSYMIASSITTHTAEAADQAVSQAAECKTRLTGLGFQTAVNGDVISANMSGLDSAAYELGQASIASLSCQGWTLSRFCMGEGCRTGGGVHLELSPAKLGK